MVSVPKIFSRKPGAMLSLVVEAFSSDDTPPGGESAWDVTLGELHGLVHAGALRYILLSPTPGVEFGTTDDDRVLEATVADAQFPTVLLFLAGIDTAGVCLATVAWLPRTPSVLFFVVAAMNGLLIGLILGIQTWFVLWLRKRRRTRRSAVDRW
jgi:uncharacterized integral membrane protein